MTISQTDLRDEVKVNAAIKSVFSGPEGELVLQYLCNQACVYQPTYVRGDVNEMLLNEGARRLVLSLVKKANFQPNQLPPQLTTTTEETTT